MRKAGARSTSGPVGPRPGLGSRLGGTTLALVLLAVLTGCDRGPSQARPPASTQPSGITSASAGGSTSSAPRIAPGWSEQQQGNLRFAVPEGFHRQPQGVGMPGAAVQYVGTTSAAVPVAPAVAVFVETGQVGSVQVRASLLADARSAQLGARPVDGPRAVSVPGSQGAALVEWRWDYVALAGKPPVPSRQVEVVIGTNGKEQYGVLIGGPTTYLTDEVVADFLAGLAVPGGGT